MKFMTHLFLLAFFVRVTMPFGLKVEYKNVKTVVPNGYVYQLTLANDKTVFVPSFWTVIEEQ